MVLIIFCSIKIHAFPIPLDAIPMLITGFQSVTIQSGPSLTISCTFSGNPRPRISWYIDDNVITSDISRGASTSNEIINGGLVKSHLNLTKVNVMDGGLYTCRGSNDRGESSHSNRINVFGLPGVRKMNNISVVSGATLRMRCSYYGYPISSTSWLKGKWSSESTGTV